jgi:tetratricopeptide (TPR) repeat protein
VYDTGIALLSGRLDEVEGRSEEALKLGLRLQHPYARGCFTAQRANLHALRGEPEELLALMEPALGARQGPVHWVRLLAARALVALGREGEALPFYEEVLAEGIAGIPRNLRWMSTLVELAHCCADLGDADRAGELVEILRPFASHHGVMPMVVCYGGPVAFALARLYERLGRADDAEAFHSEALVASRRLGALPIEPHIQIARGKLARRHGRHPEARERLASAASLAADLGMDGVERAACAWLEKPRA